MIQITENYTSEFYPTPRKLLERMLSGVVWSEISTVLEPSAGKGDIADYIKLASATPPTRRNRWAGDDYVERIAIECIEIDTNLQHILRGKGHRVIHDDFLTFGSLKKYDLIVMNPPFSEGDKHLMKALELQSRGGKIICLLNSETLKDPYSHLRKLLLQLLSEYEASICYVQNAFSNAERRSDVEVAIVMVDIPAVVEESIFYANCKKAERFFESEDAECTEVTLTNFIEDLVAQFNVESHAGVCLIREYLALQSHLRRLADSRYGDHAVLTLTTSSGGVSKVANVDTYLRGVRLKYWRYLLTNSKFMGKLTSNLQNSYRDSVDKLVDYDFTLFNIQNIMVEMNASMTQGVKDTIMALFDRLSAKHTWCPECAKNIHYWNGWQTNQAHKVGYKVIIPVHGLYSTYSWNKDKGFDARRAREVLEDIEKSFNYLDGGLTAEVNLESILEGASANKVSANIQCKYFSVTFYKKGTVHIKFTNTSLVDKFNIFAARNRAWLPPSYGKKTYANMSSDERETIDNFQGEAEYSNVLAQSKYYIHELDASSMGLPLLETTGYGVGRLL